MCTVEIVTSSYGLMDHSTHDESTTSEKFFSSSTALNERGHPGKYCPQAVTLTVLCSGFEVFYLSSCGSAPQILLFKALSSYYEAS